MVLHSVKSLSVQHLRNVTLYCVAVGKLHYLECIFVTSKC